MAKGTGSGDPNVETTPVVDPPIASDVAAEFSADDELEQLRRENVELRAELAERGTGHGTAVSMTTDADPAERRRTQAEHEQAILAGSEGARQDRLQQENIAQAEGRPVGSGVRFGDTPASAMAAPVDHDDLAPFDDDDDDEL